jgi:hypothetical protein
VHAHPGYPIEGRWAKAQEHSAYWITGLPLYLAAERGRRVGLYAQRGEQWLFLSFAPSSELRQALVEAEEAQPCENYYRYTRVGAKTPLPLNLPAKKQACTLAIPLLLIGSTRWTQETKNSVCVLRTSTRGIYTVLDWYLASSYGISCVGAG